MKTLEQFKNETLGGSFGNPVTGTYKGQCVSYVRLYMEQVLGIKTIINGHASNYYNSAFMAQHFDKVSDRRDGDILCWGNDAGSWTGAEGHIGISYQGKVLNQNYGGSRKVTINDFFPYGYQGALRLKGGEMPISDTDNEYARWRHTGKLIRGRDMTRTEFRKAAVGKTWLRALEILSDDPEATKAQLWQDTGKVAVRDNWQRQISDLQSANTKLQQQLASEGTILKAGKYTVQ